MTVPAKVPARPRTVLPAAQPRQRRLGGEPVGHLADARLELAQRVAGLAPEPAVGLAHVEAALGEQLLQLVALRAGEDAFVPGAGLPERPPAAEAVGEMADGERIGLGRVVLHDGAEVLQHQEARPLRPGRYQQVGAILGARERLAAGAGGAPAVPFPPRPYPPAIRK